MSGSNAASGLGARAIVEKCTRVPPGMRWTSRSVAKLTEQLREAGHEVAPSTVERRLKARGYSLQANRKSREGAAHPDRDAQFAHIAQRTGAALGAGEPVISVDTKRRS